MSLLNCWLFTVCRMGGGGSRPSVFSRTTDFLRKPWDDSLSFSHNIAQSPVAWQSQSCFFPHLISPLTPTLLLFLRSPYLLPLSFPVESPTMFYSLLVRSFLSSSSSLFTDACLVREKSAVWHYDSPPSRYYCMKAARVWGKSKQMWESLPGNMTDSCSKRLWGSWDY